MCDYPTGKLLFVFIARILDHFEKNSPEKGGSPYILIGKLIHVSPDLARTIVEDACSVSPSSMARFVSSALARLWDLDVIEGRSIVERFLRINHEVLLRAIGHALASIDYRTNRHGSEELSTLKRLLSSENSSVAGAGIAALRRLAQADVEAAMSLALSTNIGTSPELADELSSIFTWPQHIPFDRLSIDHVMALLEKFMPVAELDGHWLETFLALASKAFPRAVADFFMRRVERAAQAGDWHYRPCNNGPYGNVPLRLRETAGYGQLLAAVVQWMKQANYQGGSKSIFDYRARELFDTLFGSFDGEVVQLLDDWSAAADKNNMRMISNILYEAPPQFVFSQTPFVLTLLERAKRLDKETFERVSSSLLASAIGGLRQGVPGEPFPRDLQMKADAECVLRSLSRFAPGFELYDAIKGEAERGIERSNRDREAFED